MGDNDRVVGSVNSVVPGEVFCPEQLLHRCLGNIDLAQRVLDRFVNNVDQDVEQLLGAVREKDSYHLARTAHRVKGSAGSIAAPRLQRLMAELELAGRDEGPADVEELLKLVQGEMELLKEVLGEWRGGETRAIESVSTCSSPPAAQENSGYATSW